jgi:hypothetical protein
MTEIYTTGSWKPSPGREDAFVRAAAESGAARVGLPAGNQPAYAR